MRAAGGSCRGCFLRERKASQLRKLRLCSRLLQACRPRKSIKTRLAGSGRRRMARRGDSGDVYVRAGRVLRSVDALDCLRFTPRARRERFEWDSSGRVCCRMLRASAESPLVADALPTERGRLPGSNWRGIAHFSAGIRVSSSFSRKLHEYIFRSREKWSMKKKKRGQEKIQSHRSDV